MAITPSHFSFLTIDRELLPGVWNTCLDSFQKLLVLKCVRPDKLTNAMQVWWWDVCAYIVCGPGMVGCVCMHCVWSRHGGLCVYALCVVQAWWAVCTCIVCGPGMVGCVYMHCVWSRYGGMCVYALCVVQVWWAVCVCIVCGPGMAGCVYM